MRFQILFILFIVLFPSIMTGQNIRQQGFTPKNGFVPDERTAVAIAEAVLIPIYGKEQIDSEKPLTAKLKDGIWTVQGRLPNGWDGGVAIVKLIKKDAQIIFVEHEK